MSNRLANFVLQALADRRASAESPGIRLDAAAMEAHSARIALDLEAHGLRPREPVLLKLSNAAPDIAAFLGVWRAGGAVVPIHHASPPSTVERVIRKAGIRLIISDHRVVDSTGTVSIRDHDDCGSLVIFTSGSTGEPKGVVLDGDRLAAKLEVLRRLLVVRSDDVVLLPLQLSFVYGIWVALLALLEGARLVQLPKFDPGQVASSLQAEATVGALVPSMLRMSDASDGKPSSSLRLLLTGGEALGGPLSLRTIERFPEARIFDLFGLSETGSCDFALAVHEGKHLGTLGQPTEGVSFRIAHTETPGSGELQIRTPFGMIGYLGDPTLTDAVFDDGWFRTGDLARQCEGGIALIGRAKEIISRGGMKIAPLEVEAAIASHPLVHEALCGSIAHETLGEAVHILVALKSGAHVTANELRLWAADRIEHYKLPNAIHIVDGLPLGKTGKADRRAVGAVVASLAKSSSL
ncbi:class I adenylate-forming enzyme family protein [Rhodomicrobium lacus]|uniref:class I adenylate-forming enzyme family protein n=1 Tax=Rhodomicrobium lacus TaxID=2498452 RepID=UPI0026E3A29B|nr:fatty acid--CoA ligase family protein [Rhodomicrobium lacus]WKW51392.1 fatty acid--CoA ligase family protein [Rhodomicrobium lacus]